MAVLACAKLWSNGGLQSNCLQRICRLAFYEVTCEFSTSKDELPTPPKKPLNKFLLFSDIKRAEIMQKFPDKKMTEVSKMLGDMYKNMSEVEKEALESAAEHRMAAYKKEYANFMSGLSESEQGAIVEAQKMNRLKKKKTKERRVFKKECRELDKPKRPAGAFLLFFDDSRSDGTTTGTITKQVTELGKIWRSFSVSEKQAYQDKANAAWKQYEVDLMEWERKMIKDGRQHLVRKSLLPKPPSKKPAGKTSTKKKAAISKKAKAKKTETSKSKSTEVVRKKKGTVKKAASKKTEE